MGIRALLAAIAVLALAPGAGLAQVRVRTEITPLVPGAVPPASKPHVISPDAPTLRAPGDTQRIVVAPEPGITAEAVAAKAGAAGSGATLVDEVGVNKLIRHTDTHEGMALAEDISKDAKRAGGVASAVSAGANAKATAEKCGDPSKSPSECAQAGLATASNLASVAELAPKVADVAGKAATTLQVASDMAGAHQKCIVDKDASKLECIQGVADTLVSAGSTLPGGGKVISATYSIAKDVLPAAVDKAGIALTGQSPGAYYYDKTEAAKASANAEATANLPGNLQAQRDRRNQAYRQSSGALVLKEEAYQAKEREIAERNARALEAQARAQSQAYQGQVFYNGLMNALQPLAQAGQPAPAAPCAFWAACNGAITTQAQYDSLVAKAQARQAGASPPPAPSSGGGGCNLTAEDRAKGRVCTAN